MPVSYLYPAPRLQHAQIAVILPSSKFIGNRKRNETIGVYKRFNLPEGELAGASKDMVHVNDAAEITLRLMKTDKYGIVNCWTEVATAYSDIAEMINPGKWAWIDNPFST